jgi:hypothetical protein
MSHGTTTGGRGHERSSAFVAAASALLVTGALVLGWALWGQQADPPAPDPAAGLSTVQGPSVPGPTSTEPPVSEPTTTEPTATEPTTAEPTASEQAAAAEVEVLPPSEPVAVDIPGIQVSSPLHPLGLDDDGALQVPSGERYDEAAWYDGSPTPGEPGPTVIEGHVTSQGSTPSVFFELGALGVGDTVDVTREDGTVVTFEVYATDSFPKDSFPKVAVYGNTAGPELRLITCGGDYDPVARAHVDNIVVFARMVGHTPPA